MIRPALLAAITRVLSAVREPISLHVLHQMLGGRRALIVLAIRELEAAGTVAAVGTGRNGRKLWLAERPVPEDAKAVIAARREARRAERMRA